MADTSIYSTPQSLTDARETFWGPYFADTQNAVAIVSDSQADITKLVTANAFTSTTATEITAGTVKRMACFPDQGVPGDSGTLVHVAWLDVGDGNLYYVNVDSSDGTTGTVRTVSTTLTVSTTDNLNRLAITKTVSGNIIIAGSTQTETFGYKSSDNFATAATSIASPYETATQEDHVRMFPANTSDNNDACCLFWDRSADELSLKKYDDSGDSWASETSIATSMVDENRTNMDGAVRHSDGHLLAAAHSDNDTTGDDLQCWDINPADTVTVTAKTNVFTNQAESSEVNVIINQQNDDVYISHLKGGTWLTSVDVVYHKSTDGMGTWGTEQTYSEDTADDVRVIGGPMSITSAGGRILWGFYNDDTTDIFVNLTNDIEITASGADHELTASEIASATSVESPAITQVHDFTATALDSASSVESPALTQVHGLTGSEIASTSSVGSPTLTQGHALSANEIASTSSVESPTLTQVHALTASEIASATEAASPTITQAHSLTASEIASTSSVDSPTATESHQLTADSIAGTSSVESPAITQVHALGGSEISSTSSVGQPTLSQSHALTADEIGSTSIVESPAIGTGYVFSAADLSLPTSVDTPPLSQLHVLSTGDLSLLTEVGSPELGSPFYNYPETAFSTITAKSVESEIDLVTAGSNIKTNSIGSGIGSKSISSKIKTTSV